MENKKIIMPKDKKIQTINLLVFFLMLLIFFTSISAYGKEKIVLTDTRHINITYETAGELKKLKQIIKRVNPKGLYIEQWIVVDPKYPNLLKKLNKIAKKNDIKLYLVIGKNTWFGKRAQLNTLEALKLYKDYIDGIVLRAEPNKINIWKKDDASIKAQILNFTLDGYLAATKHAKEYKKLFIGEFPFWYSDFSAPGGTFSENSCKCTDRIIFLVDDIEKLNELEIEWNNVTCMYNIDLTKRAPAKTEEQIAKAYYQIKDKIPMHANFNGFLIDSDSKLLEDL